VPRLSQTPLYMKANTTSNVTAAIQSEIAQSSQTTVTPDKLTEILSLMRLNGDAIVKKAVTAYQNGDIVIIFNKATSKVPLTIPYIVINNGGHPKAYVFADKVVNNITAPNEYTNLMAALEAAYLALMLRTKPDILLMNGQLMLTLCNIYALMAGSPLEQKAYIKGENLTKVMLYIITYFYKMFRGDNITPENIPYKKILSDKVDPSVVQEIINEVKSLSEGTGFLDLVKLIKKINPVRYEKLDTMYLLYFSQTCGISLTFALENIEYLFLLVSSASYKTNITQYGLNKTVGLLCRKAITQLATTNL